MGAHCAPYHRLWFAYCCNNSGGSHSLTGQYEVKGRPKPCYGDDDK